MQVVEEAQPPERGARRRRSHVLRRVCVKIFMRYTPASGSQQSEEDTVFRSPEFEHPPTAFSPAVAGLILMPNQFMLCPGKQAHVPTDIFKISGFAHRGRRARKE
jgi:hypothetical protein